MIAPFGARGLPKTPARKPVPRLATPLRLPANPELAAWRVVGADLALLLEAVLAAQGDRAPAELFELQHRLTALLSLPATQ